MSRFSELKHASS
ncbi:hypothetical protein OIU79_020942, partial [Salix purpurea]